MLTKVVGLGSEFHREGDADRGVHHLPELPKRTEPSRDSQVVCWTVLQHFVVRSRDSQGQAGYRAACNRRDERDAKDSTPEPPASADVYAEIGNGDQNQSGKEIDLVPLCGETGCGQEQ